MGKLGLGLHFNSLQPVDRLLDLEGTNRARYAMVLSVRSKQCTSKAVSCKALNCNTMVSDDRITPDLKLKFAHSHSRTWVAVLLQNERLPGRPKVYKPGRPGTTVTSIEGNQQTG